MSRPLYHWHRDLIPIAQEIFGASKPCEWARKISPPLEFEPRNVQAVVIRCNDFSVKVMYLYFRPEKLRSSVISAENNIRYPTISQNISYPRSMKSKNGCNKYKETHLFEPLHYKQEGRDFDSRWCHWKFSLT
jgi:hypothetical protein